MEFLEILLVLISGAGLLHGVFFASYLCFFSKKRNVANWLLGLMLFFMAFRIGKSVMLYFGEDLEPLFIFAGLSLLLLIGPLLRWYILAMTTANFKLPKHYNTELAPFLLLFCTSFFIRKEWFNEHNKSAIVLFASSIIFIYLHLASYIIIAARQIRSKKRQQKALSLTKSQLTVFSWLRYLLIGFVLIWVSYVLNIIEDTVPYIFGPIVYSIVIYYLSFIAFKLKSTTIDGDVFAISDNAALYEQINSLMVTEKMYLEPDVSLANLSKRLKRSTQKTSEVINQYARQNFNDYVNYHRIQEAKKLLTTTHAEKYTISSIAFDIGFSSLSSFNAAFKKFEGTTPSSYKTDHS